MKEVSARLKHCVGRFPTFENLHPFEQSVLDLAVGVHNYRRILDNAESLRKETVKVRPASLAVLVIESYVLQFCGHIYKTRHAYICFGCSREG